MNRVRSMLEADWAHQRKITGSGIGAAILDTGILPHPDFVQRNNRIVAFKDFTETSARKSYDPAGHGTHVAGILAGDGSLSAGKYCGIAPDCKLVALKVLNKAGDGSVTAVKAALEWILAHRDEYNIRIINLSFGSREIESGIASTLNELAEKAWNEGFVVVAAAGNSGPEPGSITAPGSSRKVITVGGEDISFTPGRGPTCECIRKPEVVAPSAGIVSCMASVPKGRMRRPSYSYVKRSGTSMTAPMVSGAVALLLSQAPELTNKEVKQLLRNSAVPLSMSKEAQGWGRINIRRLLQEKVN